MWRWRIGPLASQGEAENALPDLSRRRLLGFAASSTAQRVPQIDPSHCNGCSACISVCAPKALQIAADNAGYTIASEKCTSCELCVQVCDQGAIRLLPTMPPDFQAHIALDQRQCPRCSAVSLVPQGNRTFTCRFCSASPIQRGLLRIRQT